MRLSGKNKFYCIVGAASSRDHLISRLACDELSRIEAAPTGFFMITFTFQISTLFLFRVLIFS
jgi:hypothetical protein